MKKMFAMANPALTSDRLATLCRSTNSCGMHKAVGHANMF